VQICSVLAIILVIFLLIDDIQSGFILKIYLKKTGFILSIIFQVGIISLILEKFHNTIFKKENKHLTSNYIVMFFLLMFIFFIAVKVCISLKS
jgi:hypothetical protein